jgi:hypothetical protein
MPRVMGFILRVRGPSEPGSRTEFRIRATNLQNRIVLRAISFNGDPGWLQNDDEAWEELCEDVLEQNDILMDDLPEDSVITIAPIIKGRKGFSCDIFRWEID